MNSYETQRLANILSFLTDFDFACKKKTIYSLVSKTRGVTWAIACSGAMFFDGAWDEMHDFDIVIAPESLDRFLDLFLALGGKLLKDTPNGKEGCFKSGYFAPAILNGVEFDLIVDFTVTTYNTEYCYRLKEEHIRRVKNVPIIPMEANMLLYGMMRGWQEKRVFKYQMCVQYLKQEGLNYPEILENVENLPKFIRNDVTTLLKG